MEIKWTWHPGSLTFALVHILNKSSQFFFNNFVVCIPLIMAHKKKISIKELLLVFSTE
jgi:hypothetical protein